MSKKTIIIGSGIGAIALSIRLKTKGFQVEVFESNDYVGGKLSEITNRNYRFDAGPSLFTMPHYVDELFELANENPRAHFDYQELENICNYFWEDGTRLSAYKNIDKFESELETKLKIPKGQLKNILEDSQLKYELTGKIFLEKSIHQLKTWWSKDVLKALLRFHKLDIFKSMHQVNEAHFDNKKMVQFFNRFATYNGSNPYKASGILNIIPHFEHHFGAFFPKGGMINITKSLYLLAKRLGVQFHLNAKVDEILVENNKAIGVSVNGKTNLSDIVISNMDIYPTYQRLLKKQKTPSSVIKNERSSSALIFYWGIKKSFPQLDLHNILFSNNYKKEFDEMANGRIDDDPTIYIHISSKYHKDDAPEACENWFVMINVPHNNGQDWDTMIQLAKKNIINKINRNLNTSIEPLIETENILDPRSIELRTSSFGGSLYGTASNDMMAAFNRHANFSKKIKNLYFCGGSVHPGGGIPLCLLSAKITAELISGLK